MQKLGDLQKLWKLVCSDHAACNGLIARIEFIHALTLCTSTARATYLAWLSVTLCLMKSACCPGGSFISGAMLDLLSHRQSTYTFPDGFCLLWQNSSLIRTNKFVGQNVAIKLLVVACAKLGRGMTPQVGYWLFQLQLWRGCPVVFQWSLESKVGFQNDVI